jgi:hypothetical protein
MMAPCEIEWEGEPCKAFLLEVSLRGALLNSSHVPPAGSVIRIKLRMPHTTTPFEMEGQLMKFSDQWRAKGGRFAVRFLRNGTELMALVASLRQKMILPK